MDSISLDYQNPFLYVAGAAGVSMLINFYCCLHKCRSRSKNVIVENLENQKIQKNMD